MVKKIFIFSSFFGLCKLLVFIIFYYLIYVFSFFKLIINFFVIGVIVYFCVVFYNINNNVFYLYINV